MGIHVILIGSSDRQLDELLRACGAQVASQPATALAALAQPRARQPDLIVLDLRGQAQLPSALPQLTQQHPSTGVLIVASKLDPTLMLEAMRARVNECVTEPVTEADLKAAIDRLLGQRRHQPASGQVFAFLGAKGGVGTTTVAVNVATALAQVAPAATLFIDLHLTCGDAALYLGAGPRFSVVDALENIHRFDEAFFRGLVVRTGTRLDLLASSNRVVVGPLDVDRIRALIQFAAQHYRYVVLDVPRSDAAMLDALGLASTIILVVNQELPAVRSASRIAATLRQRYGKERVSVVVSRYDTSADIRQEDVERVMSTSVRYFFPSDYRTVLEAMNRGRPVAMDNHNKLATAFGGFARVLAGVAAQKTESGRSGGLFGRWTGRHRE